MLEFAILGVQHLSLGDEHVSIAQDRAPRAQIEQSKELKLCLTTRVRSWSSIK